MDKKKATHLYQKRYRDASINRLKRMLGLYCHGCETPDTQHLQAKPLQWLELVIRNRRAPDLAQYSNNTLTIYNGILRGKIPLDRVTLVCPDCKFDARQETNIV
jgi:hypothetical protein